VEPWQTVKDSSLIRAIGFLYLRYTCPPTDLWKWFESYLEDEEELLPSSDPSIRMTIGSFCVKLLTEMQYFGTTLPRIPIPIERKMKVMLLLLEEKKRRRRANLRDQQAGRFADGAKVKAIYSDEASEPAWYQAEIVNRDADDERNYRYWVTFPEYGNTELVDLGDMELLLDNNGGGATKTSSPVHKSSSSATEASYNNNQGRRDRSDSRDRDRDKDRRSRSRDREREKSSDDLLEKVLKSELEALLLSGGTMAEL
jgi:pre-mRNA-splicing factor 38B